MRLSKNEYVFFLSAALIVCIFSLLFYFDFTSRTAIGQERIVGSIVFKKRVAQRKFSDQVIWEDIEQTASVYNNDSIRTSEQSEAVVRLSDGTEITVNENTMIQVSLATNEIDIQFRGGSISARRSGLAGDDPGNLRIQSEGTTVNVAASDVQMAGDPDRGVSLVVTRGGATVTAGGTEQSVKENQKVLMQKGAKNLRVVSLPLKLLLPHPDSILVTPSGSGAVAFTWEQINADQDGILEVSDTGTFAKKIIVRRIKDNKSTMTIPPGIFFWRIRAKNRNNGNDEISETRKFTLVRIDPASLQSPYQGQVVHVGKSRPVIRFAWSGGDAVRDYILEIATDRSMRSVVGSYRTSDNSIAVDTLAEGTYYWRIVSSVTVGGISSRIPSAVRELRIALQKEVQPPSPLSPPDNATVNGMIVKEKGIIFSWSDNQDIESFRLAISTEPGFSRVIYRGITGSNFINIRHNLKPGKYFWRVQGVTAGNSLTVTSPVMRFNVADSQSIAITSPADGTEVLDAGRGKGVKLAWEKTGTYGEYLVQIADTKDFRRIIREEHVTGSHAVVSGMGPGTHYWRVMVKNTDGTIVMMSRPATFVVADTLPEPTILSPGNRETIDMKRLDELDLKWRRLAEANAYQVRLYRVANNRTTLISERTIRGTNVAMENIHFPGEGDYRWSVQAFEMNGEGSKIIKKSPVSRGSFTIQASAVPKKIKIITPRVIYVE